MDLSTFIKKVCLHLHFHGCFKFLSDKLDIKILYLTHLGRLPNFRHPKTFNEKLNWLKLYNRNPLYTTLVDKYAVKKWVADKIGEKYIIPTLGVWEKFDDIDFSKLPNQFVLKCTHDSAGLVICNDKSKFDKERARKKITKCLKRNYFYVTREWPYKNVSPRIIAEKYMEDADSRELRDYKFYTLKGLSNFLLVVANRKEKSNLSFFNYFDGNGNSLQLQDIANTDKTVLPPHFEKMKDLAKINFYEIGEKFIVGQYSFGGSEKKRFWDKEWGEMIELPVNSMNGQVCLEINGKKLYIKHHQNRELALEKSIRDYKFFCFNGTPQVMYVSRDKAEFPSTDFFDMDFNRLDMRMKDPNSFIAPPKPHCFEEMKKLAATLSMGIPHVRVDFYEINGDVYFGEMTFFHNGGFTHIYPTTWENKWGEQIDISSIAKSN